MAAARSGRHVNDEACYLATDPAWRESRFRFTGQGRTSAKTMPLNCATEEWPQAQSEYEQVGTLINEQAPGTCLFPALASFHRDIQAINPIP
ncbi:MULTISPECIES: hypothetical protein [unclassified Burkholderia]|uniref:hypothetical protein n=1 Tax=unclassified Burkholderia TaxID=2613784 RepID=UPI001423863C|nr:MULTISPECIES: hypothetical protein [unclassified Burkholderia]NIE84882.1 hypothetical protein [Burkholderia sp. Tr-860]NIF65541.1 hypothetical protein [Burkholderia sp. Cy-647]NIF98508.1 hypothetical protein [Burkholderia sp. Ax-1720]